MIEEKLPPPSRRKDRRCRECPTMIRRDNKSGLCGSCVKTSPDFRKASSEAAKRKYEDPEQRKKTGRGVRRANQLDPTIRVRKSQIMKKIAADPAWKARNAEQCKDRKLWEQGVAGRTPESDAKAGLTFSRRHGLAIWCPEEYLEQARELRRSGLSVAETRRMIYQQQERDMDNGDWTQGIVKANMLRCEAHALFDPLWQSGITDRKGRLTRKRCYYILAHEMGMTSAEAHFKVMDRDTLLKAIPVIHRMRRRFGLPSGPNEGR